MTSVSGRTTSPASSRSIAMPVGEGVRDSLDPEPRLEYPEPIE
jgi:hypothetical protein